MLDPRRVHTQKDLAVVVDEALYGQLFPVDAGLTQTGQSLVGVDLDEGVVALRTLLVMDQKGLDVGDLQNGASW